MISLLEKYILGKKVLILGFGREGKSTLRLIKKHFPLTEINIADKNQKLDLADTGEINDENLFLGEHYLDAIQHFDVIIKSPGINIGAVYPKFIDKLWLSQTGLFLEQYHRQIIGVTGTKGKSTTSSLIHHILKTADAKSILVGNIGQPPFDLIDQIDAETHIVFELSANQLEFVKHAPYISILLNLFPEHLDYFGTCKKYFDAKMNIAKFQKVGDVMIYDSGNANIADLLKTISINSRLLSFNETSLKTPKYPKGDLPKLLNFSTSAASWRDRVKRTQNQKFSSFYTELFNENEPENITGANVDLLTSIAMSNQSLRGRHNIKNISAAALACFEAGINKAMILKGVETFVPLEHRLEFVGNYCGIDFYNDSISTIPESTIEAVNTIKNIHTLILGGFDRGIDYSSLVKFLSDSKVVSLIFTGPAGKRMMAEFQSLKNKNQQIYFIEYFNDLGHLLQKIEKGKACVLSPAASSYDQFKDFEERGRVFKKMAESLKASCP